MTENRKPINWRDFGIYGDQQLPTDWVHVVTLDDSEGYDWTTLHAFYSPTARRYFWASDSGCSCNYWGEGFMSAAAFEDGDKAALKRALRDFGTGSYLTASEVLDALDTVARFDPKAVTDHA